jgi:hypothetical protein
MLILRSLATKDLKNKKNENDKRKIELIEAKNKLWKDLYGDLIRDPSLRSG